MFINLIPDNFKISKAEKKSYALREQERSENNYMKALNGLSAFVLLETIPTFNRNNSTNFNSFSNNTFGLSLSSFDKTNSNFQVLLSDFDFFLPVIGDVRNIIERLFTFDDNSFERFDEFLLNDLSNRLLSDLRREVALTSNGNIFLELFDAVEGYFRGDGGQKADYLKIVAKEQFKTFLYQGFDIVDSNIKESLLANLPFGIGNLVYSQINQYLSTLLDNTLFNYKKDVSQPVIFARFDVFGNEARNTFKSELEETLEEQLETGFKFIFNEFNLTDEQIDLTKEIVYNELFTSINDKFENTNIACPPINFIIDLVTNDCEVYYKDSVLKGISDLIQEILIKSGIDLQGRGEESTIDYLQNIKKNLEKRLDIKNKGIELNELTNINEYLKITLTNKNYTENDLKEVLNNIETLLTKTNRKVCVI